MPAHIRLAIGARNKLFRGGHGLVCHAQRIGSHIGDQAHGAVPGNVHALIQRLRGAHGARCGEAQLAAGLLLHGAGDERRRRHAAALAARDGGHRERLALYVCQNGVGLGLCFYLQLFAGLFGQARGELFGLPRRAQHGVDVPVFLGLEGLYLLLPVHNQAHGHALHAPGRKPAAHFAPQKRAELIAHQPVQHAARLLGVEQVHIDGARGSHALLHALFGNFAKGDAVVGGRVQPQKLGQMPADGLALAVRVRCKEHLVALFGKAFQLANNLFLALDVDIFRLVVLLHVDAELALRQIADMAHGGRHLIAAAQIFADGFGFRRGFYDD